MQTYGCGLFFDNSLFPPPPSLLSPSLSPLLAAVRLEVVMDTSAEGYDAPRRVTLTRALPSPSLTSGLSGSKEIIAPMHKTKKISSSYCHMLLQSSIDIIVQSALTVSVNDIDCSLCRRENH